MLASLTFYYWASEHYSKLVGTPCKQLEKKKFSQNWWFSSVSLELQGRIAPFAKRICTHLLNHVKYLHADIYYIKIAFKIWSQMGTSCTYHELDKVLARKFNVLKISYIFCEKIQNTLVHFGRENSNFFSFLLLLS